MKQTCCITPSIVSSIPLSVFTLVQKRMASMRRTFAFERCRRQHTNRSLTITFTYLYFRVQTKSGNKLLIEILFYSWKVFYMFVTDMRRRQIGQILVTSSQLLTHSEWNKCPHWSFFNGSLASKFVRQIALKRNHPFSSRSSNRRRLLTNRSDWTDQPLVQRVLLAMHRCDPVLPVDWDSSAQAPLAPIPETRDKDQPSPAISLSFSTHSKRF